MFCTAKPGPGQLQLPADAQLLRHLQCVNNEELADGTAVLATSTVPTCLRTMKARCTATVLLLAPNPVLMRTVKSSRLQCRNTDIQSLALLLHLGARFSVKQADN